jgi:hypothetical protein
MFRNPETDRGLGSLRKEKSKTTSRPMPRIPTELMTPKGGEPG